VSLHGTRPWHPQTLLTFLCSRERESPRRKAVASGRYRSSVPTLRLS